MMLATSPAAVRASSAGHTAWCFGAALALGLVIGAQPAAATAIAIFYSPAGAYIASDSLIVPADGSQRLLGCKLHVTERYVLALSGLLTLATDTAVVFRTEDAVAAASHAASSADDFDRRMREQLAAAVAANWPRDGCTDSQCRAGRDRLAAGLLTEMALILRHPLRLFARTFEIRLMNDDRVVVTTLPGSVSCADETCRGFYRLPAVDLGWQFRGADVQTKVRSWIEEEIARRPDTVGGPVQSLAIDSLGQIQWDTGAEICAPPPGGNSGSPGP